ncbi:MAG TPA: hypothetical protein D7H88_01305 [Candidatus Poseidoniales archaeon]|nr:MAG TPA: hypothetical protein D7H88_01305 [Candidatus Poseidoniales archaeon]
MSVRCAVGEECPITGRDRLWLSEPMRMTTFVAFFLVLATLGSPSASVVEPAQAASACEGEVATPDWNTSAQRLALVPHASSGGMYFIDEPYYDEDGKEEDRSTEEISGDWNPELHPEENWMYNPTWPLPTLEPLTDGQYAVMEIGNDSAGVLRLNLSSAHRTTFCISLYELVENATTPANADVYLMTTSQYNSYEEVYRMMHGGWWYWDSFGDNGDELLSDIPPEWRSFNPIGWQTYRDVHQYESTQEATFSISMDGPEVYNSLFGGAEWQDFYLVIDAWDNTNDGDEVASNSILVADITVIPTERTALLPPWTVPLTLFVLLAAVVIVPVLLNKRYMEAGLDQMESQEGTPVPVLEQQAARSETE